LNSDCRSLATVLVGSVEDASDVDEAVVDEVPEVEVAAVADVLAWRSVNSFCSASLMLDPLLLVEFTAVLLLRLDVLDEPSDDELGKEVLLVLLLLLPVMLLYRS
jgi:hypothetical protein